MQKRWLNTVMALAILFVFTGCESMQNMTKKDWLKVGACAGGGLLGLAGGLVLGNAVGARGLGKGLAGGLGAGAGSFAGCKLADALSEPEKVEYNQATERAVVAPIGQPQRWGNSQGNHGVITPIRDEYVGSDGQVIPTQEVRKPAVRRTAEHCREYQTTIMIGGEEKKGYGKACLKPDGAWHIISSD